MRDFLRPELGFRDFLQILKNENYLVEITSKCDPTLAMGATMKGLRRTITSAFIQKLEEGP